MKHLSRRVRLALVAAAVGGGALAVPATAAHATVTHSTSAASPSSILSVCLTIREVNFKQCVVI
jgi:hypothetical protein